MLVCLLPPLHRRRGRTAALQERQGLLATLQQLLGLLLRRRNDFGNLKLHVEPPILHRDKTTCAASSPKSLPAFELLRRSLEGRLELVKTRLNLIPLTVCATKDRRQRFHVRHALDVAMLVRPFADQLHGSPQV